MGGGAAAGGRKGTEASQRSSSLSRQGHLAAALAAVATSARPRLAVSALAVAARPPGQAGSSRSGGGTAHVSAGSASIAKASFSSLRPVTLQLQSSTVSGTVKYSYSFGCAVHWA